MNIKSSSISTNKYSVSSCFFSKFIIFGNGFRYIFESSWSTNCFFTTIYLNSLNSANLLLNWSDGILMKFNDLYANSIPSIKKFKIKRFLNKIHQSNGLVYAFSVAIFFVFYEYKRSNHQIYEFDYQFEMIWLIVSRN